MSQPSVIAFKNEYEFLSMTYNSSITVDGITYSNAESAFWAQRVKDVNARFKYTRLSGNKARAKALQAVPIDDWDESKNEILKKILRIKFSDDTLKKKLLDTGTAKLKNNNTYRDDYYGIYMNRGKNLLGKFLEELREELKEEK